VTLKAKKWIDRISRVEFIFTLSCQLKKKRAVNWAHEGKHFLMQSNTTTELGEKKAPTVKICCACPEQKKLRDYCFLVNGPEKCTKELENYYVCLLLSSALDLIARIV
jgi:hypothetical protein